jgi:myosin heavy subunit
LTARSAVLQGELESMQQMQREVLATLERARAERSLIHAELAALADTGKDPQIEILRISRDFLTVELAEIEGAKARILKETGLINSRIEESRELAAEFEMSRAKAQQQFDQVRAKVIEIQEKELDAQLALNSLEDKVSVFQKQRDELLRFERELQQREQELDQIQTNFENEVANRIAAHNQELAALSSRARKKAIKRALDDATSEIGED